MTDTPGWAPPSSPEPSHEATGPSAAPSPAAPQDAVPPTAGPQDAAPQPTPPPVQGWGAPGPYGAQPYGGAPHGGAPHAGMPYGGQPYARYPGWGAPPSPKPGVIPLRPLGVGEILDGAMSTVRRHWRTAFGLSFGIAALEQTLTALAQWWQYQQPHTVLPVLAELATYLVNFLLVTIAAGMLTMVVSKAILGERVTPGTAWAAARPQLAKLGGLTIINILILAGIILLSSVPLIAVAIGGSPDPAVVGLLFLPIAAGCGVAFWVYIQLSLAAPALMLEKQGIFTALSRSRRLVKGSWWRIAGITVLSKILIAIVAAIILIPFTVTAAMMTITSSPHTFGSSQPLPPMMLLLVSVGGVIAATLTIPVQAAVNVLLYVDQRIRREALDIELARAAGLPEYGATSWAGTAIPGQSTPPGA